MKVVVQMKMYPVVVQLGHTFHVSQKSDQRQHFSLCTVK